MASAGGSATVIRSVNARSVWVGASRAGSVVSLALTFLIAVPALRRIEMEQLDNKFLFLCGVS